jgi:hypothetical protein
VYGSLLYCLFYFIFFYNVSIDIFFVWNKNNSIVNRAKNFSVFLLHFWKDCAMTNNLTNSERPVRRIKKVIQQSAYCICFRLTGL